MAERKMFQKREAAPFCFETASFFNARPSIAYCLLPYAWLFVYLILYHQKQHNHGRIHLRDALPARGG